MQLLPMTSLQTAPGGFGLTDGENELAPPGVTAFSVGETEVVVVVVVVDGLSFALELQAVNAPIPTIAAPPAKSAIWRVKRP